MLDIKIKKCIQCQVDVQYKNLIKNKLFIENPKLDEFLKEFQQKRDEYCLQSKNANEQTYKQQNDYRGIESAIMYYLKYAMQLHKYLSYVDLQNTEELKIEWNDSLLNKIVISKTMNEELINVLYEMTIIKLVIGINLVLEENRSEDEMKDGLQKMRNSLWSINQMRSLLGGSSKWSDCKMEYLNQLEMYIVVVSYAGLYLIHGGLNKMSYGQRYVVAGLAHQVQIATQLSLEQIKQSMMSHQLGQHAIIQQIVKNCSVFLIYYQVHSLYSMGLYHEEMVESEPSKGHFGKAISYTEWVDRIIKENHVQFADTKVKFVKDGVGQIKQTIQERLQQMHNRNQLIYKDKIEQINQHSFDLNNDFKIETKMPNLFSNLQHDILDSILGENISKNYKLCCQFIDQQQESIKKSYQSMKDLQLKDFSSANVDYLLNLINIDEKEDDKEVSLIKKIKEFKNRLKVYDLEVQISSIKDLSQSTQKMLNQQSTLLDQEMGVDYQFRQQYKQKWTRMTSVESQKQFRAKIQELAEKYRIANTVDQPMFAKFTQYQATYKNFKENPNLLNVSSSKDISLKFEEQIKEVSKLNQKLKDNNNKLELIINQIPTYNSLNQVYEQTIKILLKQPNIAQEQLINIIFANLKKLIEEYNQIHNSNSSLLSQLTILSKNVNQQIEQSQGLDKKQQQSDQNIINSLQCFLDIYQQLEQGLSFYQQIINVLSNLTQQIQDYSMARQIEANQLVQMIHNQGKFYKQ